MGKYRWVILGILAVGAVLWSTNWMGSTQPGGGGTIRIALPPWTTSPPPTYVAKVMLEEVTGVNVTLEETDIGVAFQAIAAGDIDLLLDAWMPHLHAHYFEAHGDDLDVLGDPLYSGTELGWAVPAYVPVNSVAELNEYVEQFQGRIIGIDPGAGMMQVSQRIIEAYDLDYELVEGSEFAMLAAVDDAIRVGDWIVFIAWRPHFVFAQHDLKLLEEERGFWQEDEVLKVARRGFAEDFPDAARLLGRWEIPLEDIERMINAIEVDGRPPEDVAREWVEANREQIRRWAEDGAET